MPQISKRLQGCSPTLLQLLSSDIWPINGSLGDLLTVAKSEVSQVLWRTAFNPHNLVWLTDLIPIEVPRTYNISNFSAEPLPKTLDLTVTRLDHHLHPLLQTQNSNSKIRPGISSNFLNPAPSPDFAFSDGLEQVHLQNISLLIAGLDWDLTTIQVSSPARSHCPYLDVRGGIWHCPVSLLLAGSRAYELCSSHDPIPWRKVP